MLEEIQAKDVKVGDIFFVQHVNASTKREPIFVENLVSFLLVSEEKYMILKKATKYGSWSNVGDILKYRHSTFEGLSLYRYRVNGDA
jgi:hypothetical protein